MKFKLTTLLSLCITACAAPNFDMSKLDYGPEPLNYKEIIMEQSKLFVNDPESIQVKWGNFPLRKHFIYNRWTGERESHGWMVCYSVNGKNAYGGYDGFSPRMTLIREGKAVYTEYDARAVKSCTQS
ncbi:hypothetical protein [Methylomicrobium agile]|uniref:hypothetical protein n=1 Tax=Methylomicrobium agile TaxID=39774 RepID=UPI00068D0531|nr:hypothetical protein [Methylomicrobium agile]